MKALDIYILPESGFVDSLWIQSVINELPNGTGFFCHQNDAALIQSLNPSFKIFSFSAKSLSGAENRLNDHRKFLLRPENQLILFHDLNHQWGYETYYTYLRLIGISRFVELTQNGSSIIDLPENNGSENFKSILLKICGGIGNIVLATPLVEAALQHDKEVIFCPTLDSSRSSIKKLFHDSSKCGFHVISPDQIGKSSVDISMNIEDRSNILSEDYFISPHRMNMANSEARLYGDFFFNVTGISVDTEKTFVGGKEPGLISSLSNRIVICPGSKQGWDSKRWPHFNELIELLIEPPVILCKNQDLEAYSSLDFLKPITSSRATYITDFDLSRAASLLRRSQIVIANDCGMAHVAAATGTKTLFLFGPSSIKKNRHPRLNGRRLSLDLPCQPCQGKTSGPGWLRPNDYGCEFGYSCLADLAPSQVYREMQDLIE